MRGARQAVPAHPTTPAIQDRKLRIRLILEELFETANAAGISIVVDSFRGPVTLNEGRPKGTHVTYTLVEVADCDLVEFVDGLADLSVVVTGSFSAVGVADEPVLTLVDANNLMKFRPGHWIDEHGKLNKPKDHPPVTPELEQLLREMAVGQYHVLAG